MAKINEMLLKRVEKAYEELSKLSPSHPLLQLVTLDSGEEIKLNEEFFTHYNNSDLEILLHLYIADIKTEIWKIKRYGQ